MARFDENRRREVGGAIMYYWMYQDSQSDWRWALYAANNSRIADSSDAYRSKEHCQDAIDRVKASGESVVKDGPTVRAEMYTEQKRRRKKG
jgi:uncharacterized protein YegP (UPF0339 family)